MSAERQIHYRLPGRAGGWRPGAHVGSSVGVGEEFVAHASLFARPDPRRLDLRASLRDPCGDWLVRLDRQRASVPVVVAVDVSASMGFGHPQRKLDLVADFVEALGASAGALGDPLTMLAFDARARDELAVPASRQRGAGAMMAGRLRAWRCDSNGVGGLAEALAPHAGRRALVFVLSDYHCALDRLAPGLDALAHAVVVPVVVWSPAETRAPPGKGLLELYDLEGGRGRSLWLGPRLRARWADAVAARRDTLRHWFSQRGQRPFFMTGAFDPDAMTRYFLEGA